MNERVCVIQVRDGLLWLCSSCMDVHGDIVLRGSDVDALDVVLRSAGEMAGIFMDNELLDWVVRLVRHVDGTEALNCVWDEDSLRVVLEGTHRFRFVEADELCLWMEGCGGKLSEHALAFLAFVEEFFLDRRAWRECVEDAFDMFRFLAQWLDESVRLGLVLREDGDIVLLAESDGDGVMCTLPVCVEG